MNNCSVLESAAESAERNRLNCVAKAEARVLNLSVDPPHSAEAACWTPRYLLPLEDASELSYRDLSE